MCMFECLKLLHLLCLVYHVRTLDMVVKHSRLRFSGEIIVMDSRKVCNLLIYKVEDNAIL